ncbi:hypothetical protein QE152_g4270 [Popillia japonica]|uniref:DDE-1 domain-containing protein n=1 Tax=Popillia japonica TaxID=7064 RepID=A0AAW1MZU4_POPJA
MVHFREYNGTQILEIHDDEVKALVLVGHFLAHPQPEQLKLNAILKTENIDPSQLYNYDETGLYWRVLPNSTQASTAERNTPDRTTSKDRVSVSLCANADRSHMLQSVIVGKMPEIRRYQTHILKIPDDEVKALVLLGNCPAHSQAEQLVSDNEKLRYMFLPANTTSLIHSMDQGLRSTIFNLASVVNDMKPSTLINSWQKLLINEEVESDTGGFETEDFQNTPHQAGENRITLEDTELWLEADEVDLGYHILTEEKVVQSVITRESYETNEYDQDEAGDTIKPKLNEIKDHLNIVINYVEDNGVENISTYYEHLGELIIKKINSKVRQQKISSFFKPVSVSIVVNERLPKLRTTLIIDYIVSSNLYSIQLYRGY